MKMIITLLLIIIMTMNIVMKMIITLMMIIIIALIIHYDKDHNHYADHNHDIVDVLNSDADDDDDVLYNVSLRVQAAILLRSVQDHGVTPLLAHLLPLPVQSYNKDTYRREGKGRRCAWGAGSDSIPCRTSYFAPR